MKLTIEEQLRLRREEEEEQEKRRREEELREMEERKKEATKSIKYFNERVQSLRLIYTHQPSVNARIFHYISLSAH